jgi:hypothetical protein
MTYANIILKSTLYNIYIRYLRGAKIKSISTQYSSYKIFDARHGICPPLCVMSKIAREVWNRVHRWFDFTILLLDIILSLFESFLVPPSRRKFGCKGVLLMWHAVIWTLLVLLLIDALKNDIAANLANSNGEWNDSILEDWIHNLKNYVFSSYEWCS